jgi:hypothetical protein
MNGTQDKDSSIIFSCMKKIVWVFYTLTNHQHE